MEYMLWFHVPYHKILISQQISYKMYMISYMICHENSARKAKIDMILYDIIQFHGKNHDIMYNIINFFMISIAQERLKKYHIWYHIWYHGFFYDITYDMIYDISFKLWYHIWYHIIYDIIYDIIHLKSYMISYMI